jgi:3'-phosphoadenosine 5'-phosphosulfate (PAPS) 3'-phosphatase
VYDAGVDFLSAQLEIDAGVVENGSRMLRQIRDILMEAVLAGGSRIIDVRRTGSIGARYKDATELVTEADQASDAAILSILSRRFPEVDSSISFHLEESGIAGTIGPKRVGADPLDGTSHFVTGGNLYSVQAHYIEDGVPLVGVVFQPEVYLPLSVTQRPSGRLVSAVRGEGAETRQTKFVGDAFQVSDPHRVAKRRRSAARAFMACVPITGKMTPEERALARKVNDSGLIGGMTGTGGAGGNVMMAIFGGHEVYANFGAGDELDLAPGQVIAQETGLTVWGRDRRPPVWHVRKQPVIVAPDDDIAELFLAAAGL